MADPFRGARDDLEIKTCAQCGKQIAFGIYYIVKIDGQQFTVCSSECDKKLRDSKAGDLAKGVK